LKPASVGSENRRDAGVIRRLQTIDEAGGSLLRIAPKADPKKRHNPDQKA
jgi:hypothetical protein